MSMLQELHQAHKARRAKFYAKPKPEPKVIPIMQSEPEVQMVPVQTPVEAPVEELKPYVVPREYPLMEDVFEECRLFAKLSKTEFASNRRTAPLVLARQIGMYLCREMTLKSFPEIGRFIARDHTSIIHGAYKIAKQIEDDVDLLTAVLTIQANIKRRVAERNIRVRGRD